MSRADFAQRLVGVGGIHLVTAPVAEFGRGLGGFAERAVIRGRKFRGVGHDGRVGKAGAIQFRPDGAHPAVHHVAGRHDVRAGFGVAGGGPREQFQRWVVQDFSALHDAAMPVLHVFAQTHVGDDEQRRQFLFQKPDGLLDDAIFGVGAGSFRIFLVRNAEQQDRRDAQRVGADGFAQEFIGRKLEHAGHGVDGAADLVPAAGEQRQHQLGDVQMRFGHEPAQRGRLPQPARAVNGKPGQIHVLSLDFARAVQSAKWP